MLGSCDVMAFVSVTDADRARSFYESTLGLSLVEDTPFALVFDVNGTTLRVTPVQEVRPLPATVLGWIVPDITAMVGQLAERGVSFQRYAYFDQSEEGIWDAPGGARIAWFHDPDGNTLSLTQPPRADQSSSA